MGKETKIGLAVVGSLLLLFGYVLYSRISKETAAAVAKNGDKTKQTTDKGTKAPLSSGPNKTAGGNKSKSLSGGPSKPNMLKAEVATSKPPAPYGGEPLDPSHRTAATAPNAAADNPYSRPTFRYGDDTPSAAASLANAAATGEAPSFRSAKNPVNAAAGELYRSANEAASSLAKDATSAAQDLGGAAASPANDPFTGVKNEATEAASALVRDANQSIGQTADELKHPAEPQPSRLDSLVESAAKELDANSVEVQQKLGAAKEQVVDAATDALQKLSTNDNPLRPAPSYRDQLNAASSSGTAAATTSTAQGPANYDIYSSPAAKEASSDSHAFSQGSPTRTAPRDPFSGAATVHVNSPESDAATYAAPPLGTSSHAGSNSAPDRFAPPEHSPSQSRFNAADRFRPEPPAATNTAETPPSAFRSRSSSPPPPALPEAPRQTTQPTYALGSASRTPLDSRGANASRFEDADRDAGFPQRSSTPAPARSNPSTAMPSTNSPSSFGGGFAGSRPSAFPRRPAGDRYVVAPNDSYWSISEQIYGNGAYFKALQEHNRGRYPLAESMQAGDELSTPSLQTLQQTYPHLCPKPERLEQTQRATGNFASQRTTGRTYVVEAGDTLFDIARFELGKASRWSEIYELNKESLGEDFNHLTPGMKLALPSDGQADSVTRRPGSLR